MTMITWEEMLALRRKDVIAKDLKESSYKDVQMEISGEIQYEEVNEIHYIFFESTWKGITKGMVRYHMLVYSNDYSILFFRNSNVVDKGSYSIETVKNNFKNYVAWLHKTVNNGI